MASYPRALVDGSRELAALVAPYRGPLAAGLALMLLNRVFAFVLPASTKYLFDWVILPGRADRLWFIASFVAGAGLLQAATAFALTQTLGRMSYRVVGDLRKALHFHVLRLPLADLDHTATGALVSRIMSDPDGLRALVGTGLIELSSSLLTLAIGLSLLTYVNWRLSAAVLVLGAVYGAVVLLMSTRLKGFFIDRSRVQADVTGRLVETLGGIRVVKSYRAEEREHAAFAGGIDAIFAVIARALTTVSASSAVSAMTLAIFSGVVIVVGGGAILSGRMTVGDLAAYGCLLAFLTSPLTQLASISNQLTEALAGLDRIRELRARPTEDDRDRGRHPVGTVRGDVAFEQVSFAYVPGRLALRDITFVAPAGSTTALVGPSGSGKTTLTSLVMGFMTPAAGRILVDGADLATLKMRDYRQALGAVLQETFLFDGTIADNIRFARPEASLADVQRVGRLAHCDEFVERCEHGYDTLVGERGVRLSGGQRQRIAIARAMLADPRILILDEATSSLDSESEAFIQDGLAALCADRTTFVIAHRLSTIRRADHILVLNRGELVQHGSHADLMRQDGLYRYLHDRQHGAPAAALPLG